MSIGRLVLRTSVGGLFVGHGAQKLFGSFGGGGIEATAGMFGSLGMRPPKAHAVAAGVAEAGGGAALALGAFTPLASSVIIATMVTAIRKVHWQNGPWIMKQGYEYNLVLIAAALALAETGPGELSVDGDSMHGPGWAALALGLGVLGSLGADAVSKAFPEPAPEPDPAPEPSPAPTDA